MNTTKKGVFYDETDTYHSHFFFDLYDLHGGCILERLYFGESQLKADTAPVQTASCPDADSKKSSTEEKKNISGTDSVESMNHLSEEKYYVKVSGEYLSVYFSDTDRLYFETSLKVSNLPEYLRRDALEGIPFTSLENLYSFLENYSS